MVARPRCAVCTARGIDRWPVGAVQFADYEPDWQAPEELVFGPIHPGYAVFCEQHLDGAERLRGLSKAEAIAQLSTADSGGWRPAKRPDDVRDAGGKGRERSGDSGPVVTLSVVEGPGTGVRYRYEERAVAIVGRADDCDPRIDESDSKQLVSRHHCLFDINPPDIRVRDFGSLNGTYVNEEEIGRREVGQSPEEGARLTFPERDLVDGDQVRLGNTVIQVSITVPPPSTLAGTQEPTACTSCGGPLNGDPQGTSGDAVCARCQADRGAAIDELLRRFAPSAEDALPEIPGYELVKKLGDGGQGVVYLARHQASGELVAVKMLWAKGAVRERSRAMFEREIVNIKSLDHPNVVSFRESGRVGAAWFFTSEYCAAGSIDDLMDTEGLLPPGRAVPMMLEALEGLGHAHAVGLVHRDIKPGNILLARRGRDLVAKLADFGLSKAFDQAGLSGMTMTGSVGGTMPFMARPQLIQYKYAKPDVDVWSMAASLYFMLTGEYARDFGKRDDPIRVVLDKDPVPIRERDPNIPHRLAAVIDEALIDRPAITVTSAAELSAALRRAM